MAGTPRSRESLAWPCGAAVSRAEIGASTKRKSITLLLLPDVPVERARALLQELSRLQDTHSVRLNLICGAFERPAAPDWPQTTAGNDDLGISAYANPPPSLVADLFTESILSFHLNGLDEQGGHGERDLICRYYMALSLTKGALPLRLGMTAGEQKDALFAARPLEAAIELARGLLQGLPEAVALRDTLATRALDFSFTQFARQIRSVCEMHARKDSVTF